MEKTKLADTALPVYIYNSVEDEWPYISCLNTIDQQNERISLSNAYADSYLFANAGRKNFFFISPVLISSDFRAYFEKIAGATVTVLNPLMRTPFICNNTVKDKDVLRSLIVAAENYACVELYPYATTKHVYTLKKELEKYGIRVTLPESPRQEDFWTVASFGSKNGFRSLIAEMKGKAGTLHMPEGRIFSSVEEARQFAQKMLETKDTILLKTGKGSGGHGTFIIRKSDIIRDSDYIATLLKANPDLWKKNKIVVEQFIETDKAHPVRFPSVEGYIDNTGKYKHLYSCNMLVTPEGSFFGMEVGPEAISSKIERQMISIGRRVGGTYAQNGYRGHFDIDMILGADGKLYMNESNTRNTGGTDAYKITRHLLGARLFKKSFVLSKFIDLPKEKSSPSFTDIIATLSPLLYNQKAKAGLILSSEAALHEYSVTYFIAARTKKEAYAMEKKLLRYFHYPTL